MAPPAAEAQYTNFEGHQIHPLDITPDGTKLLAVNTPDARLSIYTIDGSGNLSLAAEVPVGTEPVSVRARTNTEAWVINHVSDSISIVDLTAGSERVKQTIKTDDEPTDVIFAGSGDSRAFVSISQRNRVDVYDAINPTSTTLFQLDIDGEDPRALARNAAGTEVYAAVFHSGNQTLIISGETGQTAPRSRATDSGGPYSGGPVPPPPGYDPNSSPFGPIMLQSQGGATLQTPPATSIIVKWRDCKGGPQSEWCDDNDNSWDGVLTGTGGVIQMPDKDVAIIDAVGGTPSVTSYVATVGTLNFGIAVNPATGRLYVSNTDSQNHIRFPRGLEIIGDALGNDDGVCDSNEPTSTCLPALNGHLVDTRVTVATGTTVNGTIDLNPHIDYDNVAIASIDKTLSLGQPNGMTFNGAGNRLYAAAILSRKVAVIDTSTLPGTLIDRIDVGEGPTGVALSESINRLYVLNRHENSVSIVNTATNTEILPRALLFNPEPAVIRNGRMFLYDGQFSSGRGDVACATCHSFGELDLLAWDLGNPTKTEPFDARPSQTSAGVAVECANDPNQFGCGPFHPLKGPMTDQTLRGLQTTEPFHWRGDKVNFQAFNGGFTGPLRRSAVPTPTEMDAYADFIMTVSYPPNPNRNLDDTLTASAAAGLVEYMSVNRDANIFTCNQCHALPTGTNGRFISAVADQIQQAQKTPQLRNLYEKTGLSLHPDPNEPVPATTRNGFGFVHEGAVDSLVTFLSNLVFTFTAQGDITELNNMVDFMMEFPTGQAAAVGHQITFDGTNGSDPTFATLLAALDAGDIDLIVKGISGGISRTWRCTAVSASQATCQPDRALESTIDAATLRNLASAGSELTFWAVPVGFGQRMGLDRDLDTFFDQDEIDAGSNPADPLSTPLSTPVPALGGWAGVPLVAALAYLIVRRRGRKGARVGRP